MSFEIVHKPTFTNQLLAIPKERVVQVLEKVERLREDPRPHGDLKKKLHGYEGNVYRLRSGDYRVLYTYGDGWVTLLGVDDRKDIYRGDRLLAEEPEVAVGGLPDAGDLLKTSPGRTGRNGWSEATAVAPEDEDLPFEMDVGLLWRLRVPRRHRAALLGCRTLDDLLVADVPEPVRNRVFDAVYSPDYDRVLQQPDLVTGDVSDLLRFKEGELLGFLLRLDPEQERYVRWALNARGPTLVKGGPGTGKSTVAMYRARSLVGSLRESGVERPKILFTTYTNALVSFSEQLLRRLLGDDRDCVTVRTADSLAMRIVASADGKPEIADGSARRAALEEALKSATFEGNELKRRVQARALERLSPEFLLEEISDVIEAREISTLEAYLAAPRAGRRVGLKATRRTAVWRAYEAFSAVLARRGLVTWQGMRRRAAQIVRTGGWAERFDGVLVDEAQDLDPTVLRLLVALCRSPNRLFVAADANQSIYGSGFRWSDVHEDLRFVGRTGVLRRNHRSTREIGEAARSYLREGGLEDPEDGQDYAETGPKPAVRVVSEPRDETALLARFLKGAAKEFRLGVGASAVLVPSQGAGRKVAAGLSSAGLEASYMTGKDLDLGRGVVKIVNLKSAKGLEFPVVAVAGFSHGRMPGIPKGASGGELEEALLRERRTLYVAMTRAMRALLVALPANGAGAGNEAAPLFGGFDDDHWNVGSGALA